MSGELTLILGGVRSGKSAFAAQLAERSGGSVLFLATMAPGDEEDRRRVRRHQTARPGHWQTVEEPLAVPEALLRWSPGFDAVVLDCLTLWVARIMESECEPTQPAGDLPSSEADRIEEAVERRVSDLLAAYAGQSFSLIIVSNEVGAGLVPVYPRGRLFRDLLGLANQRLAAQADSVHYLVAGLPLTLKRSGAMVNPESP
jgi:adenosylcobinamide kinase/adenosylcobinamide-phosphate guanylyltransferase